MKRVANGIFALVTAAVLVAAAACGQSGSAPNTSQASSARPGGDVDRTVLPIAEPTRPAITELDARNAKAPPIFEVKAPAGAPNVLVILLDNFGYAGSTTFGGVMHLPTIERLAKNGLTYTNFHTAPICSASRVALLTGRNPHSANMGTISEMATGFPGQTSILPNSVAPLAKILRFNGYSTAMFGKSHEYVPWESGLTGPFDQWPTGLGFEKFYGNVIGESDQFSPVAHDNTTLAPPSKDPNYYYQTDLADRAIQWIKAQKSLNPDKPFFVYYPAQGMHDPVQMPKEWRDKYKGKFDMGWDKYREEILARQKKLGIVPENTKLTRQGRHRARLGHADRRREEGRDPLSGALRGVCRADRLRDRPGRPGDRRRGRAGQHPDHLRHGRQRRQPQRRAARRVQHDEHVQPVAGDAGVPARRRSRKWVGRTPR